MLVQVSRFGCASGVAFRTSGVRFFGFRDLDSGFRFRVLGFGVGVLGFGVWVSVAEVTLYRGRGRRKGVRQRSFEVLKNYTRVIAWMGRKSQTSAQFRVSCFLFRFPGFWFLVSSIGFGVSDSVFFGFGSRVYDASKAQTRAQAKVLRRFEASCCLDGEKKRGGSIVSWISSFILNNFFWSSQFLEI